MVNKCIYCGNLADTRDHLNAGRIHPRRGWYISNKFVHKTVPACMECNNRLGTCPETEVPFRAEYLLNNWDYTQDKRRLKYLQEVVEMGYP